MNDSDAVDLSRRGGWRFWLLSAGRVLAALAVLLTLYYVLPLDDPLGLSVVAWLVLALGILAVLAVYDIRAILRSPHPRIRAIEALSTTLALLLVAFAATYYRLSVQDASNFSEPLTRTDSLYFVVTVFSTVGFGDITAQSQAARSLVSANIVMNLVVLGLGVRAMSGAVDVSSSTGDDSPTES